MKNQFLRIQRIQLEDYEIDTTNVKTISIFNNIDNIGYILEIVFNDITDIKNKLKIKGGETLKFIAFDEENARFKKEFIVNKIQEIAKMNEYNVITKLSLISKDSYFLSVNRDYNYYNETISDIVKKYIPTIEDENPTDTRYSVIIAGFSKTKAIQYMISNFTKSHILFENVENFVFSDLNNLLVKGELEYVESNTNPLYRYSLIDIKEIEIFNSMNEAYNNIYKNVNISLDLDRDEIVTNSITIQDIQESENILGSGDNFSENINNGIDSRFNLVPYSPNVLNNNSKTYDIFNKKYEILVYGNFSLEIGKTIEIRFKDRFNSNINSQLNGTYLITKLAHSINEKEFYTKMEVSKNSYFK